eukprot:jgi/Mesvir1/11953/Mv26163-RA.1
MSVVALTCFLAPTTTICFPSKILESSARQFSAPFHRSHRALVPIPSYHRAMQTRMSAAVPRIIYGTAWKKDRTADLVYQAVMTGFRAIDTACQPKHYKEPGVGEALLRLAADGISREQIFLQTKYTPVGGQDPNDIPYDPSAPLAEQVKQSVAKSLSNLHTDYLDSLVLHSPLPTIPQTLEVHS